MKKLKHIAYLGAFLITISAFGCGTEINNDAEIPNSTDTVAETSASEEQTEAPVVEDTSDSSVSTGATTIHCVAVGDDLVQEKVYESAQAHAENGETYNFDYIYGNVTDKFDGDLNIINQETLICGEDYEITGSNFNFNSPVELGDAVVNAGFNVITLCNNHLLDKGTGGLIDCVNYWDEKMEQYPDLLAMGVYKDYVDMDNIRIKEVKGKKVAFLAYTENTNGYSLSDNAEIEIIYTSQEDVIQKQIEEAKQVADVVVVACHWGSEDTFTTTDGVKALAQKIINWGGDVIIGTHPHVAQSMEYITRDDGTQGFVFYSLGNFVSAQTDNMNLVGEIADFDINVSDTGAVTIENVSCSPVITHYDDGSLSNLRLYTYAQYNDDLAASHGLPYCTSSTGPSYQVWSMEEIQTLFETAVPEEYISWE